jgi:rod shape-determining protein MreC
MFQYLRNSKIMVLATLLVIGVAMGIAHNRAQDMNRSFIAESVVRTFVQPLQLAVSGSIRVAAAAARAVRPRGAIIRENEQLKAEVRRLSLEVSKMREDAAETKRLRSGLGLRAHSPDKLVVARIISRNPSEWFITATIDRGSNGGVQPGQAVITPWGFLGQVMEVSPTNSLIRAATDSRSGVGAMVQRSRAVGICQGQQDPEYLHLTYLAKDADIKVGDIIITSGQGGIVPKGLPIGRVVKVEPESGGFTKSAILTPSVKFDRAEEVYVVIRQVD